MITKVSIISILKWVFSLHNLFLLTGIYILVPDTIFSYPLNGLDPSWMIAFNKVLGKCGWMFSDPLCKTT